MNKQKPKGINKIAKREKKGSHRHNVLACAERGEEEDGELLTVNGMRSNYVCIKSDGAEQNQTVTVFS